MAVAEKLRVLLVEDEPPARRRLRALLEDEPGITIAGECGEGRAAVEMIRRLEPDVVFLDVELPELNGIEVIEEIGPDAMPCVIFVTAYDEYAVRAFDVHAVDYLLKPFSAARLQRALERARAQTARTAARPSLAGVVHELRSDRLAVKQRGRIVLLRLEDVDYVTAEGAYLRIHSGDRTHLIRETISALEARLSGQRFARVHRSLIVNLDRVRELEPLYRGEYVIWLTDGTRLVTGRTYRERIQQVFGL